MNKWLELLLGLILIVGAVVVAFYSQSWAVGSWSFNFWNAAWEFLKGGVFWVIAMLGVLFVLLGLADLKG
jgi:hypothetical protein